MSFAERTNPSRASAVFVSAAFVLAVHAPAAAAPAPSLVDPEPPEDEIIVTGGRLAGARASSTVFALDEAAIVATRAAGLDAALRFAPSAAVQTNSRGESLVFLRGAGERQTALFFAGAPLNVPWDNRLNLGLVPTRIISDAHITSGPASVLFGANTAGGVIELSPAGFALEPRAVVDFQAGAGGLVEGGATGATMLGAAEIVLSAGGLVRDGFPLSGDVDLPFFQDPEDLRTNTDLRRANGLARIAFDRSGPLRVSATVLAVDADFGVAPEGNEDPVIGRPRFWRYPDNRNVFGVLNAGYETAGGTDLTAALWTQHFNQTIESYASADYDVIEDIQRDRDRSYGLRAVAKKAWGDHRLRGAFSVIDARHRQTDEAFDGPLPAASDVSFFQRRTFSLGAEYERRLGDVSVMLGAGGDVFQSPATGGRENAGGMAAWSLVAAADWRMSPRWSFSASAGRKPRLPTQRELFGEAVGRFLVNPDLAPEIPIQLETAVQYTNENIRLTVTPFATFTSNTIDQETVVVDGERRRWRINLEGSRAVGVEIAGGARLTDRLSVSGNASVLNLRRRREVGGPGESVDSGDRFIAERPSLLAFLAAEYAHPSGAGVRAEARRRGRAFAMVDNEFLALPRSTEINLEFSYAPSAPRWSDLELFVRVDNLNDALVEPQLGLPGPGRWVRGGLRVELR